MSYLKKPSSKDRVTAEIKVKYFDGTVVKMTLDDCLEEALQEVLNAGTVHNATSEPPTN